MDWDFVIPMTRDDLLSSGAGEYKVNEIYNSLEIRDHFADCKVLLKNIGEEFILENFDTFYSVLMNIKKMDVRYVKQVWDFLVSACQKLESSLPNVLKEGLDAEKRSKYANIIKMLVYLVTEITKFLDEQAVQKKKDAKLLETGKGRKKARKSDEDGSWEEDKHDLIQLLFSIFCEDLDRLWDPPVVEQELINVTANCCYKLLEDPCITLAKSKTLRDSIMNLIGLLLKRYRHARICVIKLMQLLKTYEHVVTPIVKGIALCVTEYSCPALVKEMVKEISMLEPGDLVQDTSGTKAFSQFLTELSEELPLHMLGIINLILPYLDDEPYPMRNAVLTVLGEIILRVLSTEQLSDEAREKRDEFLERLEDHLMDCNAFVRSKTLQIWLKLCREQAIPLSFQGEVLKGVVKRLSDKNCSVKKFALQVLTAFLERNPFAARLKLQELEEQYKSEIERLKALGGDVSDNDFEDPNAAEAQKETVGLNEAFKAMEPELRKIIERALSEGSDDLNRSSILEIEEMTEADLKQMLTHLKKLLTQKRLYDSFMFLRCVEVKYPNAEEINMESENGVDGYVKLLKKFFVDDPEGSSGSQGSSQTPQSEQSQTEGSSQSQELEPNLQPSEPQPQLTAAEQDALKTQKLLVEYLKSSITFVKMLSTALPIVEELLTSSQTTDINEAIEFFTSASLFGLPEAARGVREMLALVWSKEQGIKESVANAYMKLYLTVDDPNGRNRAIKIVKNLSDLLITLSIGQRDSLQELVKQWVKNGNLDKNCIQVMWERFSWKLPDTSEAESRAALILLSMVGKEEPGTVNSNLNVIEAMGINDKCFSIVRDSSQFLLNLAVRKYRFEENNSIILRLVQVLISGFSTFTQEYYIAMSFEAIDVIYDLSDHPDKTVTIVLQKLRNMYEEMRIKYCEDNEVVPLDMLCRLVAVSGHIAYRQMKFLDIAVFSELKRRNVLREENKNNRGGKSRQSLSVNNSRVSGNTSSRNSASNNTPRVNVSSASCRATPRNKKISLDMGMSSDEGMGGVTMADDQEGELIRSVCEKEIVTGNNLLSVLAKTVVHICSNPNIYDDFELQMASSLALSKMMLVSAEFCDQHLQLFVSMMEKSQELQLRSNLVIAMGDMAYRFPNVVEPWTPHIYGRLHDPSPQVRRSTIIVLSNLIMNEMIKVKGQISDMAMCIVDKERIISDMACSFFCELSKKGNALYNTLPDIISRLSSADSKLSEDDFQTILKFILTLVQKERQQEGLIEKLCQRFQAAQTELQWRELAFCLTLVPYNDRCIRKLLDNIPCYADKLQEPKVYEAFNTIISATGKNAKQDVKTLLEELQNKIEEYRRKGTVEEDKATEQSPQTPAQGAAVNNRPGTAKSTARKGRALRRRQVESSDSESEEDKSDIENHNPRSARRSARVRTATVLAPKPVIFDSSSESEDEHVPAKQNSKSSKNKDVPVREKEVSTALRSTKTPGRKKATKSTTDDVFATPRPVTRNSATPAAKKSSKKTADEVLVTPNTRSRRSPTTPTIEKTTREVQDGVFITPVLRPRRNSGTPTRSTSRSVEDDNSTTPSTLLRTPRTPANQKSTRKAKDITLAGREEEYEILSPDHKRACVTRSGKKRGVKN